MSIMISSIAHQTFQNDELQTVTSLDDLLLNAFAEVNNEKSAIKTHELERIQDPRNALSPEDLYLFQTRATEYNLSISLYSALARKAVAAIDTVIRA